MTVPAKIIPCLWFNFNAEEAVDHYLSIFKDGRILEVSHYGDAVPAHKGKVMTIRFEIEGQSLLGLNAGPNFPFTEAISLMVGCDDQAEIDELWSKLSAGGSEGPCGWLKDKFGLSWQIYPRQIIEMYNSPDRDAAARTMQAMMQMKRLDIAALRAAYEGK
ncbi:MULTISPECIES: VOC family protein [unclassified Pseudoxanthomonas]|jgi:predicted 3-demethylubiquinone-9 3-methyltransferase (glyoxalase superfamily)|uniref:VOC family protein n=1 Tax=unclassified Pseudoxanthomonas TaxID=2645906 RepID=UPI0030776068